MGGGGAYLPHIIKTTGDYNRVIQGRVVSSKGMSKRKNKGNRNGARALKRKQMENARALWREHYDMTAFIRAL